MLDFKKMIDLVAKKNVVFKDFYFPIHYMIENLKTSLKKQTQDFRSRSYNYKL